MALPSLSCWPSISAGSEIFFKLKFFFNWTILSFISSLTFELRNVRDCLHRWVAQPRPVYVTSFSSISYYSNLRLISMIDLVRNFQSIVNQKSMFHLKLSPPPCVSTQSHITPFPENRPIIQFHQFH